MAGWRSLPASGLPTYKDKRVAFPASELPSYKDKRDTVVGLRLLNQNIAQQTKNVICLLSLLSSIIHTLYFMAPIVCLALLWIKTKRGSTCNLFLSQHSFHLHSLLMSSFYTMLPLLILHPFLLLFSLSLCVSTQWLVAGAGIEVLDLLEPLKP